MRPAARQPSRAQRPASRSTIQTPSSSLCLRLCRRIPSSHLRFTAFTRCHPSRLFNILFLLSACSLSPPIVGGLNAILPPLSLPSCRAVPGSFPPLSALVPRLSTLGIHPNSPGRLLSTRGLYFRLPRVNSPDILDLGLPLVPSSHPQ